MRKSWESISYSLVLLVAYFDMLLCWDLMENSGQLLSGMFSTVWGAGIVTTLFMVFILFQITFQELISKFSALLVTLLTLPLIVMSFSYLYSVNGVCDVISNPEQCIYYSVAAFTPIGVERFEPVGELAMYTGWQAFLGLLMLAGLISQFVSLTSHYRELNTAA